MQRIKFIFSTIFYWLIFFILWKVIFMIYHHENSFQLSFFDWFRVFWKGTVMDLSITFYIFVFINLILVLISFFSKKIFAIINKIYVTIVTIVTGLIYMVDLELYKHWKIRLDATPLKYLTTPAETFGSADLKGALIVISIFIIVVFIFLRFYYKKISKITLSFENFNWKILTFLIFFLAFSIIPIRGGIGIAPLNVGFVYFHKTNNFANHAAINPVWNVVKSLLKLKKNLNINYLDNEKATKLFYSLYPETNSNLKISSVEKPNIIIIILESFYTKFTEYSIDNKDVTPYFNLLKNEGIYFKNCYASGVRTDYGVPAILCGYPAHPVSSIVSYSSKIEKLPFLMKDLKSIGYNTEWLYGGNNNFANFNSFLVSSGFDNIYGLDDFPNNDKFPKAKWGVHDEFIVNELFNHCNSENEIFAKVFLSLSNHEPFEIPKEPVFEGNDNETKFLNTANYTDSCIYEFVKKAKNEDWWKNTLIFITADHGTYKLSGTDEFDKQHIPLLIIGGALSIKDTIIEKYISQTDLPSSILKQLQLHTEKYTFSKDIFSEESKSFAFFAYNNAFGFVTDSCKLIFDNNAKSFIKQEGIVNENFMEISKAYFQFFINDYNSK